jgi:thymidylate synthase
MTTIPHLVRGDQIVETWIGATRLLIEHGDRFNLTVHINQPNRIDESQLDQFCPRRAESSITKSVYDVANTIFPAHDKHCSFALADFFDHYRRVYERGQRRYRTSWGCYFLRLVSFGRTNENQLGKIINALSTWKSRPRAAFVLHLSSTETDNPRSLGAPCWQYGQFVRNEDSTLSLVVVYRSHDYFEKALGNFVGLARLLRFVCEHTRMTPGTLTCLSTYATLQGKQKSARRLLGH